MDYRGVECPVCKNRFTEDDDIVVCPECGTPHHRECWLSVSHCANEDRHCDGFVFEKPEIKQAENEFPDKEKGNDESGNKAFSQNGETDSTVPPVISAPILGGIGQLGMDFGENATVADIPINEAAAFVGEDSSSSKLLFKMVLTDKFRNARMNFAVLLFPYLWFFYRKMYKIGVIVIALTLVLNAVFTNSNTVKYQQKRFNLYMKALNGEISIEEYYDLTRELQEEGTGNNYYYDMAPQFINMAIRVIFALLANKLYIEHMKKQVLKTREQCSSMDEYMAALRKKGGKSVVAAVLSVIGFTVVSMGLDAVLYAIFTR